MLSVESYFKLLLVSIVANFGTVLPIGSRVKIILNPLEIPLSAFVNNAGMGDR